MWRTDLRSRPRGQRKRTKRKPKSEGEKQLFVWEGGCSRRGTAMGTENEDPLHKIQPDYVEHAK